MNNNSSGIEPKIEELKELVKCCPQGHNLLNLDCPFRNFRELNDENLVKVLCRMTPDEIEAIVEYHAACREVGAQPH